MLSFIRSQPDKTAFIFLGNGESETASLTYTQLERRSRLDYNCRDIYRTAAGSCKPELLLLDPQVVQVPEKSRENYENYKVGQANPEDSAWVKVGGTYSAVGFLVKKNFHAVHCLESLKGDSAIPCSLCLKSPFVPFSCSVPA